MEPNNTMPSMEPKEKSGGALIGSIIIIVILVLGGIYLISKSQMRDSTLPAEDQTGVDTTGAEATAGIEISPNLSTSDDLNSIEADLNSNDSTNINSADQGLQ